MATSPSTPAVAAPLADLTALSLDIEASFAEGAVNVSGLIGNIGAGSASGPFAITIAVTISAGDDISEYSQLFEVPDSVTLFGQPASLLPALEDAHIGGIVNPRPTTYQTGKLQVPLRFRDVDGAIYSAQMLVDPYFEVADANRANNMYTFPNTFWYLSPAARKNKGRFLLKHV